MPSFFYGESLGMVSSLLHYSLAVIAVVFIYYKKYQVNYKILYLVLFFWIVSQIILICTFLTSSTEQMSLMAFPSLFRPLFLFFIFFSVFVLNLNSKDNKLIFLLSALIILMFVYNLLQVFSIPYFDTIHKMFYFRDKFEGRSVYINYFFTSYSAGYIALIPFFVFLSLFVTTRIKVYLYMFFMASVVLVMAQSKTMFFAALAGCILIFLVGFKNWLFKLLAVLVAILLIYLFYLNLDSVFSFLKEVGFRQARSLEILFTDRSESGTLNVRNEQIFYAFEEMKEMPFYLGVGLGREIYLESWVADSLYRYGVYGIGLFFSFVVYSSLWALRMVRQSKLKSFERGIYLSFFAWAVTLPISQMSSPLHETGKTAALTMFFIGAVFAIREKNRLLNENKVLNYNTSFQ